MKEMEFGHMLAMLLKNVKEVFVKINGIILNIQQRL